MSKSAQPAFFDVRGRGFRERIEVAAALEILARTFNPLGAEQISVEHAYRRVLASDVVAPRSVPGFSRAAMDGYAVRAEETFGATALQPLCFRLIAEALPGRPAGVSVKVGECVRIMTGAPLPEGADAVVPFENTREIDELVEVSEPLPPQRNVGRIGEDFQAGSVLLKAGRLLRPQDIALLASAGVCQIKAVRRPRVAVIVTGEELVSYRDSPSAVQIVDSNSIMLRALASRDGAEPVHVEHVIDSRHALAERIDAAEADVLLISGGSSVGREDHAPPLLAERGSVLVHGVALRPASPAGFGLIGAMGVFLMPGNPVSCLCAYDFFAGPALRKLGGRSMAWPYRTCRAVMAEKLVSAIGRVDYARIRLLDEGAVPLGSSGAAILSSTTFADGFVIVPQDSEGYPVGATVDVFLYDEQPR